MKLDQSSTMFDPRALRVSTKTYSPKWPWYVQNKKLLGLGINLLEYLIAEGLKSRGGD